jgi:hypothetical protein
MTKIFCYAINSQLPSRSLAKCSALLDLPKNIRLGRNSLPVTNNPYQPNIAFAGTADDYLKIFD